MTLTVSVLLRCVSVCSQSRWPVLSAGQCCTPAAVGTIPGAPLGNSCLAGPLHLDNDFVASCLHSGPLCGRRRGESDQWLLSCPPRSGYSSVSTDNPKEADEVCTSLVPPLASPAGWPSAAARDACPTSLLCNMHWTQLYPCLFIQLVDAYQNAASHRFKICSQVKNLQFSLITPFLRFMCACFYFW